MKVMCASTLFTIAWALGFALAEPLKPPGSAQTEACAKQLPNSLHGQIKRNFPSHRLIQVADYSAEDVAAQRQSNGGNPCLGVSSADFDGNKAVDFAFLLVSNDKTALLVAARDMGSKGWKLDKLWDLEKDVFGGIYVSTVDPGSYEDQFSEPPGDFPGWVAKHTSSTPGVASGRIESSEVDFFYTPKGWVHLWLGD